MLIGGRCLNTPGALGDQRKTHFTGYYHMKSTLKGKEIPSRFIHATTEHLQLFPHRHEMGENTYPSLSMYAQDVGVRPLDSWWFHQRQSSKEVKIYKVHEKKKNAQSASEETLDKALLLLNGQHHLCCAESTHVEGVTPHARKARTLTLIFFCKPF